MDYQKQAEYGNLVIKYYLNLTILTMSLIGINDYQTHTSYNITTNQWLRDKYSLWKIRQENFHHCFHLRLNQKWTVTQEMFLFFTTFTAARFSSTISSRSPSDITLFMIIDITWLNPPPLLATPLVCNDFRTL